MFAAETTAHTLAFMLGHLALYPDVQAKVFDEIRSTWPADRDVLLAEEVTRPPHPPAVLTAPSPSKTSPNS